MSKSTLIPVMSNPYLLLRQNLKRPLFVPFAVVGDPDKEKSIKIIKTLLASGADALELGFPFSDPPADGPVIQAADKRALDAGITIDDCFDALQCVTLSLPAGRPVPRSFSGGGSRSEGWSKGVPIGLLVYYNLVLQRGIQKFYADCHQAGVASVLIADLPLEHAREVCDAAREAGILTVFMVSALTSDERLRDIAAATTGYLYLVSYVGVTGVQGAVLEEEVGRQIRRIRVVTDLPVFVGFGIGTPVQAEAVRRAGADGVIIGSRIVREIAEGGDLQRICATLKGEQFT